MIRPELIESARDFELQMNAIQKANEKDLEKTYFDMAHQMSEALLKLGFYKGAMTFRSIEQKIYKEKEKKENA